MNSLESFITSPSSILTGGKQQQETSIEFQSLGDIHNHHHHSHHHNHHHHHKYEDIEQRQFNGINSSSIDDLELNNNTPSSGGVLTSPESSLSSPQSQQPTLPSTIGGGHIQQNSGGVYGSPFNSTSGRFRANGPRVVPDVVLTEPPRPTGLLMRFIFLFHPILLVLFVLPGILSFWILFITGANSVKPFFYIVFLLIPFIFQIILLVYHSRSCLFLSYGRQAVSRKFYNSPIDDQRYQLVDLHTHSVVALLDKSIQDERAFYLYLPISNQVFNMTYYQSTFRINPIGQWQVIFTWKALLSFFVFGLIVTEFILLIALRSWFVDLFR